MKGLNLGKLSSGLVGSSAAPSPNLLVLLYYIKKIKNNSSFLPVIVNPAPLLMWLEITVCIYC